MRPVPDPVVSLTRRTPESRLDWLTQQVGLLIANQGALERRLATAEREIRVLKHQEET